MTRAKDNPMRELRDPETGAEITREEIMDVMANAGYSANQRKGWLKKVLTRLMADESDAPDPRRARLLTEVRRTLDEELPYTPEIDKVVRDDR